MSEYIERINYGLNRFGQPENYTQFEADGSMLMEGTATVYKDINLSGGSLVPPGAGAPNLVNFVDGNLQIYAFDGGATTERLYGSLEMQHDYKEGSDIEVHLHWTPTTAAAGNVVWQMYISWQNAGEVFPAGTLYTATPAAAGGVAWTSNYKTVTVLSGAGKTINSQIVLQLFRDPGNVGDTYGADAGLIQIGIHYQCDTIGSRTTTSK